MEVSSKMFIILKPVNENVLKYSKLKKYPQN